MAEADFLPYDDELTWPKPYRSLDDAKYFIKERQANGYSEAALVAEALRHYARHQATLYAERKYGMKLSTAQRTEELATRFDEIASAFSAIEGNGFYPTDRYGRIVHKWRKRPVEQCLQKMKGTE